MNFSSRLRRCAPTLIARPSLGDSDLHLPITSTEIIIYIRDKTVYGVVVYNTLCIPRGRHGNRVRIRILSQIFDRRETGSEEVGRKGFRSRGQIYCKIFREAMFPRDLSTDMDRVLQQFGNVFRISVSRFFSFFKIPY